ncbi:porin [Ochrobactrum sp. GPK 3]
MRIQTLLAASAASFVFASGSQAADVIVAPEPEAAQYVRVCDAYGAGYFYIPGTETCLRVYGYLRYDIKGGSDAYTGFDRKGWDKDARFVFQTSTASETDLGTLRTFTQTRFVNLSNNSREDGEYGTATSRVEFRTAIIQLGGFKIGIEDSEFHTFTGYLGDIINDDVVYASSWRTGKISYTLKTESGISAVVALEQGADLYGIDGYMPHVLGGLKYTAGWGRIAATATYDSVIEEWSGKVRGDATINDRFSVWLQGAYSSAETPYQNYGQWGGNWAVWGGVKFKATPQAVINIQAAREDWGKTALAANVSYTLVPGFSVTPEITYTKWDSDHPLRQAGLVDADGVGGTIRFQRSF